MALNRYLLLVIFAFFSFGAFGKDHFDEEPSVANKHFEPIWLNWNFASIKEGHEYLLGRVEFDKQIMDVTLLARPEKLHDKWVRSRYILTFHSKKGLGPKKNSRTACTINFYRDEKALIFKGILVHEDLRGGGLMKRFFKYFSLLGEHFKMNFKTEIMYKPMFAKLFLDFGFDPVSTKNRVRIDRQPNPDRLLHIFPFDFEMKPKLLKSQNMVVMPEPPTENFQDVYVNTAYILRENAEPIFWQQIDVIPGHYVMYRGELNENIVPLQGREHL